MELEEGNRSLLEENRKLSEELAQCKADKEFVWLLWKQLQKQSPDLTSTVDMVVTREKLKNEQRNREMLSSLETKDREIASLQALVDSKQQEVADQNLRLIQAESEVNLLQQKLEAQQLTAEKHNKQAEEVIAECRGLRVRCDKLEEIGLQREQSEQDLRRQISRMTEDLREKQHLVEEHARKEQQIEALQGELCELGNSMSKLSAECSSNLDWCKGMDKQLKQQLLRMKEANKNKDSEIKQLRVELREVSNSRDAWANHTTLQTSTIQKLQAENGQLQANMAGKEEKVFSLSESVQQLTSQLEELKEQKCHFDNRLGEETRSVSCRPQEDEGGEVLRLNGLLEKTEKELFETRTQLEAKSEELQSLRCSHDWRLQRMRTLQSSHKLVLEQLKTYENKRVHDWSKILDNHLTASDVGVQRPYFCCVYETLL